MHEFNCPCGACGRREAAWHRSESAAIDQLGSVFSANLEDFVAECLSEACETVDYDGDRDDDFMCAALHELIAAATQELLDRAGPLGRKAQAQALLRPLAEESGLNKAIDDGWEAVRDLRAAIAGFSASGRIGWFASRILTAGVRDVGMRVLRLANIPIRKLPLVGEFLESTTPTQESAA